MTAPPGVVVVDASVALKWIFDEADSAKALHLLSSWQGQRIQPIVPSWFATEIANKLYQEVRQGNLTVAEARALHREVMRQVVVIGDEPLDAERAIEIADAASQRASYHAQYLALAERLGCELWTADGRLRDAVRAVPIQTRVRALSEI